MILNRLLREQSELGLCNLRGSLRPKMWGNYSNISLSDLLSFRLTFNQLLANSL